MVDPRTDQERIMGIVMAKDMDPIPTVENFPFGQDSYNKTSDITSGGEETVQFTPPSGKVWTVKSLFATTNVDSDASDGSLTMEIGLGGGLAHALSTTTSHDASDPEVGFTSGQLVGNGEQQPSDPTAQLIYLQSFYATPSLPLTIQLSNNLNVKQEQGRSYELLYQELPLRA